jgi:hypothetical protein
MHMPPNCRCCMQPAEPRNAKPLILSGASPQLPLESAGDKVSSPPSPIPSTLARPATARHPATHSSATRDSSSPAVAHICPRYNRQAVFACPLVAPSLAPARSRRCVGKVRSRRGSCGPALRLSRDVFASPADEEEARGNALARLFFFYFRRDRETRIALRDTCSAQSLQFTVHDLKFFVDRDKNPAPFPKLSLGRVCIETTCRPSWLVSKARRHAPLCRLSALSQAQNREQT